MRGGRLKERVAGTGCRAEVFSARLAAGDEPADTVPARAGQLHDRAPVEALPRVELLSLLGWCCLVSHVRNPHPKKVLHVGHAVGGIAARGVGVGVGRGARGGPRPYRGSSRAGSEDTLTNFFSIITDRPILILKHRALPPAREPTIHQAHGLGAGLAMRSAAARSGLAGPGG